MTYKYVGGGFIPGVPARDLTDAEAKEFGVEESPLYEKIKTAAKPVRSDDTDE